MPKNATTDPDGIRFYEFRGVKYPSVTTLRRLVGVPFGLVNWMQANVMNAAIDNASELAQRVEVGEAPIDTRRWLRSHADAEREHSADRGSKVHEAAEQGRDPIEVEAEVSPYLRQFYDWVATSGAKMLSQEGQVFNLRLGYAGSYDFICKVRDGRIVVGDIKTGKSVYADHALQLIGYALGEFVAYGEDVDEKATQLLKEARGVAVLHLSETGWEFIDLRVTPEVIKAFESMCTLAHWLNAHDKDMSALIISKTTGGKA